MTFDSALSLASDKEGKFFCDGSVLLPYSTGEKKRRLAQGRAKPGHYPT